MSIPKGKLIAIGGAEDKGTDLESGEVYRSNLNFFELGILRRVVQEAGGPSARIEIITTASTIPMEVGENYRNAFGKIGCENVDIMHVRTRQDTLNKEYLQRIKTCDAVMFSGGNQLRLSVTDGGTEFLAIMKKRYMNEDFLIAGTSAGAMAMSKTMIYEGNATRAHLKGEVKITTGLGFIDSVIIDSKDKRITKQPQFPGGEAALQRFMGLKKYPNDAFRAHKEGNVILSFVVDKKGKIRNVTTIKPLYPSLEAEARRMLASMPLWEPGVAGGEKVNVKITMPVRFVIHRY